MKKEKPLNPKSKYFIVDKNGVNYRSTSILRVARSWQRNLDKEYESCNPHRIFVLVPLADARALRRMKDYKSPKRRRTSK